MVRNLQRSVGIALVTSIAAVLFATSDLGQAQEQKPTAETNTKSMPVKSGRIAVNGLSYYYEIHGQGEPLLMLHGGFRLGSIEMFGPVLPMLANSRRVIGVDLHGRGRTRLGEREISLIDMGDDMAPLLRGLGYSQVDALGYSPSGDVAFRLAVQHSEVVRRLVMVSTGYAQDGFFPEMLPVQAQVGAGMAEAMKSTPMYQSYKAIAPRPEEFPKLLDRMGALMRKSYDGQPMSPD
jgi:pimeloyl-ACP methyl ester carboxylesterase